MMEIISILSIIIWVTCTEIRIQRLRVYNEFLTKRVAEVECALWKARKEASHEEL